MKSSRQSGKQGKTDEGSCGRKRASSPRETRQCYKAGRDLATDLTTLDLATYEAGNGIWKQTRLLKLITEKDAHTTHNALVALLSRTSIVRGDESGP